jgi:hypothetical protein
MSLLTTRFEILSLPFELTTNDRVFFRQFRELNAGLASPLNPPGADPPLIQYSVIRNKKYYSIRENGRFRHRTAHSWPIYIFVMMCVRENLYLHAKDYLFLHSGAVANVDKAVLLAGSSGSGKSTLTLALLNYCYKYLSDEVVVIDPANLQTLPFQRPIYLYGWLPPLSPRVMKDFKLCRYKERYGKDDGSWQFVAPKEGGTLPKHLRFKVQWIIFPKYNETQDGAYLRPISRAEATHRLVQGVWNINHFKDIGLKICSELVKGAECYQLEMGGLKGACELVEGLIGKAPSRPDTRFLDNIWRWKEYM